MKKEEIAAILVSHRKTSSNVEVFSLTETTFKVTDIENMRHYAVKVINKNQGRGTRGITQAYCRNKQINDLVQTVTDLILIGDCVIALLEWIDGESLKDVNRNLLPDFFAVLRSWHEKNINAGSIYSPYTDQEYETIDAFIAAEVAYHLNAANLATLESKCIASISGLNYGYATILHGDIHPGNILFNGSRFILLDPEYVHCGINMLDLDYIEYKGSIEGDPPWWQITKWAEPCLNSYFAHDAVTADTIGEIMRSVKIINSLRSISNSLIYETGTTMEVIERFRKDLMTTE